MWWDSACVFPRLEENGRSGYRPSLPRVTTLRDKGSARRVAFEQKPAIPPLIAFLLFRDSPKFATYAPTTVAPVRGKLASNLIGCKLVLAYLSYLVHGIDPVSESCTVDSPSPSSTEQIMT